MVYPQEGMGLNGVVLRRGCHVTSSTPFMDTVLIVTASYLRKAKRIAHNLGRSGGQNNHQALICLGLKLVDTTVLLYLHAEPTKASHKHRYSRETRISGHCLANVRSDGLLAHSICLQRQ